MSDVQALRRLADFHASVKEHATASKIRAAADEIESLRTVVRYVAESDRIDLAGDVDLNLDPWHSNAVRRALATDFGSKETP